MKARPKLFTVSARNPDEESPPEARLIRAQTERQVVKLLEEEALEDLHDRLKVEICTIDEALELGAAGVKVEPLPGAE